MLQVIYQLRTENEELEALIEQLKNAYPNKEIKVTVEEVEDDTEYLSRSEANHEHLMRSIQEIKERKNLVSVSLERFES